MFQIFKEHQGFGKQIMLLAKNELIKKYKGAVIGPLWSVVKPLFTLFVYWFAFEVGLKSAGNVKVIFPELGKAGGTFEYSRFLFMLIGFIPWFFINESIVQGAKSIRENRQFVNKVSFPVSTIMTYTSVARLYVHIFLLGLMYLYITFIGGTYKIPGMEEAVTGGITPSIYNLQILFYMPLMFIFFLVLSWSTAPMSAFSRDFENMIVSVMSGIFWLSGIIYRSCPLTLSVTRCCSIRSTSSPTATATASSITAGSGIIKPSCLFFLPSCCSSLRWVSSTTTACARDCPTYCKEG